MITNKEIEEMECRLNKSQRGPWKAYIEGRDHTSGSNFIMTGTEENRGDDIEMYGATIPDYDFIAHAKQDIAKLLEEIKRLRSLLH